jgi:hypothetical protein
VSNHTTQQDALTWLLVLVAGQLAAKSVVDLADLLLQPLAQLVLTVALQTKLLL